MKVCHLLLNVYIIFQLAFLWTRLGEIINPRIPFFVNQVFDGKSLPFFIFSSFNAAVSHSLLLGSQSITETPQPRIIRIRRPQDVSFSDNLDFSSQPPLSLTKKKAKEKTRRFFFSAQYLLHIILMYLLTRSFLRPR